MYDNDHNSPDNIEIIYTDNNHNQVEESQALYKATNYYDDNGNITKFIIQIRFSLDQKW